MDIHVTVEGRHDLAGQIYRQLRSGIVEGRLAGGTRLPSTRDLAVQLGVSRKTTLDVFERLLAEGYLTARAGSGTFVATGLQRLPSEPSAQMRMAGGVRAPHVPHAGQDRPGARALAKPAPVWAALSQTQLLPHSDRRLRVDFMGGVTDKSRFPFDVWRRCVNQALRAQARGVGAYREAAGEQELRLAISRYLAFSRAVASNWEDVIVTQGAQHALDLLARVVLRAGDVAAIEDPGYPPARACLLAAGAKVVPVPVDDEGLIVERLPKNARLVYVTPSHQFPLGMPMSLERRVALLEWAQQRGAVIIEDDYDCEFRFEGRPMEPLKSLDRSGIVAYVGTFSKTIFPELRVGYVVPPVSLAQPLVTARKATDWHGCTLTQRALATFMLNGDFARHLRRMHKEYAARRAALLAHLHGPLSAWFAPVIPTTAGIHLAARLNAPIDEAALVRAANDVSLGIYGLTRFYVKARPEQGLMFGYGAMDVAHIDEGLDTLAALMPRLVRSRNGA